jgi:putative phosphoribosyl transferase
MFANREEAAHQLARMLKTRTLQQPVVLAIPRGGVVTGAVLARELGAELDVVLSRKLRAPGRPELAIGAVSEEGEVFLDQPTFDEVAAEQQEGYLARECAHQLTELARRKKLFRGVQPAVPLTGRSVIVTDDGIATGSTMIAALRTARASNPLELIVAVPVAPPDRLAEIRRECDDLVCLLAPKSFWAVGQYYVDFSQVEDDAVMEVLRSARHAASPSTASRTTASMSRNP